MAELARNRPLPIGLADRLQSGLLHAAYGALGGLSMDRASAIGGRLARTFGPQLGVTRRAEHNLQRVFPEKPPAEIRRIIVAMWDNLGRVAAEYPHLPRLDVYDPHGRVEVVGAEHAEPVVQAGGPAIFFSGHFGNWEIGPLAARQRGLRTGLVYRAVNNPLVDRLLRRARGVAEQDLVPKGAAGARRAIDILRQGGVLVMLVDQKMNDGIPAPFFGREAMTASAPAQLALRFRCPLIPAAVFRTGGARFRIEILPPLEFPDSGDRHADTRTLTTRMNAILEDWILARPEQWLWLHRRWPD